MEIIKAVTGYLPPNPDDLVQWHKQIAAELGYFSYGGYTLVLDI